MFCKKCGNEIKEGEKFCVKCGEKRCDEESTGVSRGEIGRDNIGFTVHSTANVLCKRKSMYFIEIGLFILSGILLLCPIYKIGGWFGISERVGLFELADSNMLKVLAVVLVLGAAVSALFPLKSRCELELTYLMPIQIASFLMLVSSIIVLIVGKNKAGGYAKFSFSGVGVLFIMITAVSVALPFLIDKIQKQTAKF